MNSPVAVKEQTTPTLDVAELFRSGATRDEAIARMRQAGFDKIDCIDALQASEGIPFREAKRAVHFSPAWDDAREGDEALHEAFFAATKELGFKQVSDGDEQQNASVTLSAEL